MALAGGPLSDSMVDVRHRGLISFKGVAQMVTAMALSPTILSGRAFPDVLPGSKATLVGRTKGLQCRVKLPSAMDHS